jgi:hypothetical protein
MPRYSVPASVTGRGGERRLAIAAKPARVAVDLGDPRRGIARGPRTTRIRAIGSVFLPDIS